MKPENLTRLLQLARQAQKSGFHWKAYGSMPYGVLRCLPPYNNAELNAWQQAIRLREVGYCLLPELLIKL